MKINHGYQDSRAGSTQGAEKAQEAAATGKTRASRAGAGGASGTDEVNLSSLASAIQGAHSDSPQRAAYIENLSAEFDAGLYKADPEAIARGLILDSIQDRESKDRDTGIPDK